MAARDSGKKGRKRLPAGQLERAQRFEKEFIGCKWHPCRRANRSAYVLRASRVCGWCKHHRKDGTPVPSYQRHQRWSSLRYHARRTLERRELLLEMGFDPLTGGSICGF